MDKIRLLPFGGLDEDGRNMTAIEINNEIIIIDAGLKYPDFSALGVEIIIPDYNYLIENKERVKGIIITHAHDDVMGGLPYLIQDINVPIYTAAFTALVIRDIFKKQGIKDFTINKIDRNSNFKIGKLSIRSFALTHSISDTLGIAIETSYGYIVHASEYIIDFDLNIPSFDCDVSEFAEIGKQGVFLLMTESRSASRIGFTSPRHRTSGALEPIISTAEQRIFITLYQQNLYRLIEVLELAKKYKRKVYFVNEYMLDYLNFLKQLNYYQYDPQIVITANQLNTFKDKVIVIVSEQGPDVFRLMHTIAIGEHDNLQLDPSDVVIIASPVVAGTEKDASSMENELYKDGVTVETLSRDQFLTMHPSSEDLKMMLNLFKPQYYFPIKGEYRHLLDNANIALDKGFYADHILVLDNGQIATFENGKLISQSEFIDVDDVLIDGNKSLDAAGLVLKDRETLSTDGTMIVGIVIDHQTKAILGGPDVQSRGVIYLKDADYVIKECGNILENVINELVEEGQYDNLGARSEARDRMSKYVLKMTGKKPMILPVIIEINS